MKQLVVAGVVAVAAAGGIGIAYSQGMFSSGSDRLRAACEVELKDRLKSPSSYKFISMTEPNIRLATQDEYFGETDPKEKARSAKTRGPDKTLRRMRGMMLNDFEAGGKYIAISVLKYEAANSYGASVADIATCSVVSYAEPKILDKIGPTDIQVNGYSSLSWAVARYVEAVGG